MGTRQYLEDAEFIIRHENKRDALKAIKELMSDPNATRYGGGPSGRHFSWMNNANPDDWNTLEDALAAWRFPVETHENGDIVDISFSGEKTGQEGLVWDRIAEYVEDGSYIQISTEHGDGWTWKFEGGECEKRRNISLNSGGDE